METKLAVIGAIISAVATVVTAWMAVETRRMAVVASEALNLERAAILGLRDLKVEVVANTPASGDVGAIGSVGIQSVRVAVELFNAGRVPVRYKMRSFKVTLEGRATDTGQFVSRGGRVLPGSSTFFWHPSVQLNPPVTTFPAKGRVQFEFEYSGEGASKMNTIVDTIEYTLDGVAPGSRLTWLTVDEP
jgi:predicted RNA-binding protein YlqC (UPF0109 family)